MDLCVSEWSHTPTQKTAPSTTTCDYDEEDEVVYEDEDVISRGCEFSGTGFYEGDADIDEILASKYTGPIRLDQTTRLNIRAFAPGIAPSAPLTVSYVFGKK